jgi:hypothetical protein
MDEIATARIIINSFYNALFHLGLSLAEDGSFWAATYNRANNLIRTGKKEWVWVKND